MFFGSITAESITYSILLNPLSCYPTRPSQRAPNPPWQKVTCTPQCPCASGGVRAPQSCSNPALQQRQRLTPGLVPWSQDDPSPARAPGARDETSLVLPNTSPMALLHSDLGTWPGARTRFPGTSEPPRVCTPTLVIPISQHGLETEVNLKQVCVMSNTSFGHENLVLGGKSRDNTLEIKQNFLYSLFSSPKAREASLHS